MENCSETNECEKKYSTDDVAYTGPNLTCTGIETCDNLTTIITKINNFICGPEFVQTVINNIINNTVLYNQFTTIVNEVVECDTVLDCLTTTTTTTAPTTTTTTTINPNCGDFMIQAFEPEGSWEALDCSGTPVSGNIIGNDSQPTGCIIIDSLVLTNAFIKNGPDPC